MDIIKTKFEDVVILIPAVLGDERGFFMESYNYQVLSQYGMDMNFVQDNHSLSEKAGTLRGLHYQLNPKAQTKLVRATKGEIYDVVVDIRKGSPTYLQWEGFLLTEDNKRQVLIPRGYAHGFCTLVDGSEVQYKVDAYYSREHDRGIIWNDPIVGIEWPTDQPILSAKDQLYPKVEDAENNFDAEVIL